MSNCESLDCFKKELGVDDLELNIFIISGVFGGITAFLLIFTIVLCCMVLKLRKQAKNGGNSDVLHKRGFEAYTGNDRPAQRGPVSNQPQENGYGQAPKPPGYGNTHPVPVTAVAAPPPPPPAKPVYHSVPAPVRAPPPPSMRPSTSYGYDNSGGYESNEYEHDKTVGGVRVLPGGKVKNSGKFLRSSEAKDMAREEAEDQMRSQFSEKTTNYDW